MSTLSDTPTMTTTFTAPERRALPTLHTRCLQGWDVFSNKELKQLRFLRWLYRTGRLKRLERNAA